jgi:hypothetical protein
MISRRLLACAGLAVLMASCGGAEAKPAAGGVVDSVVPRDTAIARFRRDLRPVTSFEGGARSRDGLVRRFVAALERDDTAAMRALLLNRSEFGWLYYPANPEGMPPYSLTPQLLWFMIEGHNQRGYRKLLQKRGGRPLRYLGYQCEGAPSHQGENTVWGPCVVIRRGESGDTISEGLFGQIVGRGDRYKFLSYANKL